MSRLKRFIPTPTMVVAMTALTVALGGTGWAAVSVSGPRSSGGTDQKAGPSQTRSLSAAGPRGPRGPRGFRGLRGLRGLTGPQGPKGDPGTNGTNGKDGATNVVVRSSNVPEGTGQGSVDCQAGEKATGGGGTGNGPEVYLRANEPKPNSGTPTGWTASFKRLVTGGSNQNAGGTVYVICASP